MDIIPKVWAIAIFSLLQMVVISTNYFIVPQLVVSNVCHRAFNATVCSQLGEPKFKEQENHVYNEAAAWNALIIFAGFFPSLIIILPLGAMTDLVPKRKMLLVPVIASLISCLCNLLSSVYITLHLGFLAFASFVTCVFAEVPGCIMICCAFTASASESNDERTTNIMLVIATIEAGLATGSLIANYLTRYYGFPSAFLFATVTIIVNLLHTLVLVPPVDNADQKTSEGEKYDFWNGFKEHTKETWVHLVSFVKKHLLHPKNNTLQLLLFATFFNEATYGGERALITLFLKHSPLNFKADKIGIYLTLFQYCRSIGLILLMLATKRFSMLSDYTLMFIGASSMIIDYTFLSFCTTTLMVYLSTIFAPPGSFMATALRSQLTKLVPKEEHGISLSLLGLLDVSSILIMSLAANGIFAATAKVYSGFSILLMSFSNIIALATLCYVVCRKEHKGMSNDDYQKVSTEGNGNG